MLTLGWLDFPGGTVVRNPPGSAGGAEDSGPLPAREVPSLENPMDRGTWHTALGSQRVRHD